MAGLARLERWRRRVTGFFSDIVVGVQQQENMLLQHDMHYLVHALFRSAFICRPSSTICICVAAHWPLHDVQYPLPHPRQYELIHFGSLLLFQVFVGIFAVRRCYTGFDLRMNDSRPLIDHPRPSCSSRLGSHRGPLSS